MAHLMGDVAPVQKVTIVARGQALGYTLNLPAEDRYMETTERLVDLMKICLAGRAAGVVFGRVTNGAASDLEGARIARSMVFEWGMSDTVTSRTLRADSYALSEVTSRDHEQARLTDEAYAESVRLVEKHRAPLDRVAVALLEEGDASARRAPGDAGRRRGRVERVRDRRHAARPLASRVAEGRVRPRGGAGHPSSRRRRRGPRRGGLDLRAALRRPRRAS